MQWEIIFKVKTDLELTQLRMVKVLMYMFAST